MTGKIYSLFILILNSWSKASKDRTKCVYEVIGITFLHTRRLSGEPLKTLFNLILVSTLLYGLWPERTLVCSMKWKLYASKKSYLSDRLEHRVKSRLDPFSRIFDVRRARERPFIVVCQVDLSALRRRKKTCLNCGESRQLKFTARTNFQQRWARVKELLYNG